jgi:hypothetical protein
MKIVSGREGEILTTYLFRLMPNFTQNGDRIFLVFSPQVCAAIFDLFSLRVDEIKKERFYPLNLADFKYFEG